MMSSDDPYNRPHLMKKRFFVVIVVVEMINWEIHPDACIVTVLSTNDGFTYFPY